MSEQLGFLILLLVVGTGNLLLGFVLAAHVRRLHLTLTWVTIEIPLDSLRQTLHWAINWIPYLPKFLKKEPAAAPAASTEHADSQPAHDPAPLPASLESTPAIPAPTLQSEAASASPESHSAAPAPAEPEFAHAESEAEVNPEIDYREVEPLPLPDRSETESGSAAIEPVAESEPVAPAVEALSETQPAENSEVLSEWMEAPPAVADEPIAVPAAEVAEPVAAAAAPDPATPPNAEKLPSFEELAGQLQDQFADLRREMGEVFQGSANPPPESKSPKSEPLKQRATSPAAAGKATPELPAGGIEEPSWESQLQTALLENLADLKSAAETLQSAAAAHTAKL